MRTALFLALALAAAPAAALAQLDPEASPPPQAGPPVTAPAAPDAAPAPLPPGAVPPGALPPPAPRSGPYVGFSFGTGRGDVFAGGTTTAVNDLFPGSASTLALMLRCGWANGPFLFGLQANVIRSSWDVGGASATMQLTGVDVVATWAPPELGMYARVGVGPAQLSFEGGGATSDGYGGAELMFGVGATMGGLGVGIDYVRQSYDEGAPIDGAAYLLATVSLDLG